MYFTKSIEIFYLDESYWEAGCRTVCDHSPRGQKAYCTRSFQKTRFTVISAMSSLGNLYAHAVKGMGTANVLEPSIKYQFEWSHQKLAKQCVFDLENAPINNKNRSEQLLNTTGHVLVFSTRYLPEINHRKIIFGIWKSG